MGKGTRFENLIMCAGVNCLLCYFDIKGVCEPLLSLQKGNWGLILGLDFLWEVLGVLKSLSSTSSTPWVLGFGYSFTPFFRLLPSSFILLHKFLGCESGYLATSTSSSHTWREGGCILAPIMISWITISQTKVLIVLAQMREKEEKMRILKTMTQNKGWKTSTTKSATTIAHDLGRSKLERPSS